MKAIRSHSGGRSPGDDDRDGRAGMSQERGGTRPATRAGGDVVRLHPPGEGDGQSVGTLFRRQREKFGQTLDDIAADLRIRRSYLQAIEDGDFRSLPGAAYALGFVRAYADHCGLDPDEMVRRFKHDAEIGGKSSLYLPQPVIERRLPGGTTILTGFILAALIYGGWLVLEPQFGSSTPEVPEVPQYLADGTPGLSPLAGDPVVSATPGDAGVPAAGAEPLAMTPIPSGSADGPSGAVEGPEAVDGTAGESTEPSFVLSPRPKGRPVPLLSPDPAQVAPEAGGVVSAGPAVAPAARAADGGGAAAPAQTTAEPEPQQQAAAEATEPPPAGRQYGASGSARVRLTAVAPTRIAIHSVQGEVLFEGTLKPGDSYSVPDRPGLLLMTSNAGGLSIAVDGRRAPSIGPAGARRQNVFLNPSLLAEGRAAPR